MIAEILCASLFAIAVVPSQTPYVRVTGTWQVEVSSGVVKVGRKNVKISKPVNLTVAEPDLVVVKGEKYDTLPIYDATTAQWVRGTRFHGLEAFECTATDLLVPESVVVKSEDGNIVYKLDVDYGLEGKWATFGRLPGGSIPADKPVLVDFSYGKSRLDSIVVDQKGKVSLLQGISHAVTPKPPKLGADVTVLANVWVPGRLTALSNDNLYPIIEASYPEPKVKGNPTAARLLPKTWAKLQNGETVNVLAWGDSVTAGGQASDAAHQYQSVFVAMLQKRFPKASVHLTTVGWGGRASDSFLAEPPGSAFNFKEKVLDPHPDLIVMEFVNDGYLNPEQVETKYSWLQQQFEGIGAEWVILTPHFVRHDWMNEPSVRVEKDPRSYTASVRAFTAKHSVALADASLRWGHLLKEGIPYTTLLSNAINHPDDQGHEMFALSLMELFGGNK